MYFPPRNRKTCLRPWPWWARMSCSVSQSILYVCYDRNLAAAL